MLNKREFFWSAAMAGLVVNSGDALAQALSGPPASPNLKYSTAMPPGVAAPDKIETRLGALELFDGFPSARTAEKLFDNLDFQRAVQAYLLAIPAVSQMTSRNAIRTLGPVNTVVPFFNMDARTVELTANDNTTYTWTWIDLSGGPLVVEAPAEVLGGVNDIWFRWVVDVGFTGPDKGKGGKFLFLPPGYTGATPDGYHVVQSPTFNLWCPWRTFRVNGDSAPGMERTRKFTKIYPLADAGKPVPALNFIDMSGKPFNTVAPADYSFWELLNQVVQEEPSASLDQIRLGYFQSIGIEKGKPFAPDARLTKILVEAAAVGDATARAIAFHTREKASYLYPDSAWQYPFVGGYKFQTQPDVLNLDAYIYYYFMATGVTPAMEQKMVGRGSQYAVVARDASGGPLDGGKNYRLRLPPNIPAKEFWSIIVYSNQTRSMLQTSQQYPSVSSQNKNLLINADGSVDVFFGPTSPAGKENNWVETVPGKGWNAMLRLYGPLESWFDKTWRPGEVEPRA